MAAVLRKRTIDMHLKSTERFSQPDRDSVSEQSHITTAAENKGQPSLRLAFLQIVVLFGVGVGILALVFQFAPPLTEEEKVNVKLPKNFDDARALGNVLTNYTEEYYYRVLYCYFTSYIFLQTFSIPGSVFLSVLAGYLFNMWLAMFFVCLCSAIGASCCYILAHIMGRIIVDRYFAERIAKWRLQVDKNRSDLMSYMLFLRITPFLPNWFINITSPILSIPLSTFFIATFFGVAPLSFIAVSAGKEIQKLVKFGDALSYDSIALVVIAAILSLIPIVLKKYCGKRFGMDESKEEESSREVVELNEVKGNSAQ